MSPLQSAILILSGVAGAVGLLATVAAVGRALQSRRRNRPAHLPEFLPILEEMATAWRDLNDDDLARAERQLTPVESGETKLGVIHSQEARRTYALIYGAARPIG